MFNNKKILRYHKNLAFNVQWRLEEVVKLLVKEGGKKGLWTNPDGLPDFLKDIFK